MQPQYPLIFFKMKVLFVRHSVAAKLGVCERTACFPSEGISDSDWSGGSTHETASYFRFGG